MSCRRHQGPKVPTTPSGPKGPRVSKGQVTEKVAWAEPGVGAQERSP